MQLLVLSIIRQYVPFSASDTELRVLSLLYLLQLGFLFIVAFVNRKQFLDPLWISGDSPQIWIRSLFFRPMEEFKEAKQQLGLLLLLARGPLTRTRLPDHAAHPDERPACGVLPLSRSHIKSSEQRPRSHFTWSWVGCQVQHSRPLQIISPHSTLRHSSWWKGNYVTQY